METDSEINKDDINEICQRYLSCNLKRDELDISLAESVTIGGKEVRVSDPPKQLVCDEELGILHNKGMRAQRVLAWPKPFDTAFHPRGVIASNGDYLLFSVAGWGHIGQGTSHNRSCLVMHRSKDQGKTWQTPTQPWVIDFNQHQFIPDLISGSHTIIGFAAQPIKSKRPPWGEGSPIGFRTSDDDGLTWSELGLIKPANDPGFLGRMCSRWCETPEGTYLLGAYTDRESPTAERRSRLKRQYILRGENQGAEWELLPHMRPSGWAEPKYNHMMESRLISLSNGECALYGRTAEGHVWEMRSRDDGKSWSEPKSTPVAHPCAPPMIFKLADGETLIALHHNRDCGGLFVHEDRSELWASLSRDHGFSWSEPRFLIANAAQPYNHARWNPRGGMVCVSYCDLIVDGNQLHLFTDHLFRQIVHITFKASDLAGFPLRS